MKYISIFSGVFFLSLTGPAIAHGDGSTGTTDAAVDVQRNDQAEGVLAEFEGSLKALASGTDATISNVSVHRFVEIDRDSGVRDRSCKASATVDRPDRTEIAIEATASTCSEATRMVEDGVEYWLGDSGSR